MLEFIKNVGAIAGAITTVIGLFTLVFLKPLLAYKKRREQEQKENREFRKSVKESLREISDDIADLQYQSLAQAHDMYTFRGWCPASTKQQIVTMHNSYTKKGRNHLSAHYEQEIMELPEYPPDAAPMHAAQ